MQTRPRPGQVAVPWQCTEQAIQTVDVRCNLVFCCCFVVVVCLFFVCLFLRGLLPETEIKLAGARSRSCCFVHIKLESKSRGWAFESSTFIKVADAASCRHVNPVCRLLGLAPFSWVSNTQNWNRSVDPGANTLVWLIKKQILVLREPAFEFSTLAQETEPGSVQARSTICYVQGVAPFYSFKYKYTEMESRLAGGRSRFCCFVPII